VTRAQHIRAALVPIGVLLVLAFTATPVLAVRGHEFDTTFGGAHSGVVDPQPLHGAGVGFDGPEEGPGGVAVNETTGDVYVYDRGNDRVEYFSATGTYEGEFNGSGLLPNECNETEGCIAAGHGTNPDEEPTGQIDSAGQSAASVAVDNDPASPSFGDVYVTAGFDEHVVDKFSASGEYVGQITAKTVNEELEKLHEPLINREFFDPRGVAVEADGAVLVSMEREESFDRFSDAVADVFVGSSAFVRPSGAFIEPAVVDGAGNLYLPSVFGGIFELGSGGGLLRELDKEDGLVSPDGVGVEVSSGDVYVDSLTSVARFPPDSAEEPDREIERFGEGHLLEGDGVAVDSASGDVYVADASAGVVDQWVPEKPGPPTVEAGSESVAKVTAESATLSAVVDPRSEPGEAATDYEFVYGPCAGVGGIPSCQGSPYPSRASGVLAANYQPDPVNVEPRELLANTTYHFRVLAHNAHPAGSGHPQVAEGEERTFTTRGTGPFGLPDGRQWELVSPADKHGALLEPIGEGWVIQAAKQGGALTYVANAPTESAPAGYDNFEEVLSRRTASGWVSQDISPPQEAPAKLSVGQGNEYRWFSEDLSEGVVQPFGTFTPCTNASGAAQPCISPEASEQTAFLRTDFYNGNTSEPCTSSCFTPLVTGCPEVGQTCAKGVAEHANVPEGTVFGQAGHNGMCPPDLICGPEFEGAAPDGSWVLLDSPVGLIEGGKGGTYEWTAGKAPSEQLRQPTGHLLNNGSEILSGEGHLYLQDQEGEALQLDAAQNVSEPHGKGAAAFLYASSDGSRVFFSDPKELTSGGASGGVYACEVVRGSGGLECQLELTGLQSSVFTELIGSSVDGSYLYYHEGDRLLVARDEPSGWHPTTIATVSGNDRNDWSAGSELPDRTSRVAPDGEWFAFMSQESLTGYDNRDAASDKRDEEVYLYDAARPVSEDVPGTVDNPLCASCDPTGARPHGREYHEIETGEHGLVGGFGVWASIDPWVAANVPGWTPYTLGGAVYQSRYLSGNGRLFFNSSDALVPEDANNQEDVYEFEPVGVGSCTEATDTGSRTFVPADAGCVALISNGESAQESAFLDASENGTDVFFLTTSRLTPDDTEGGLSIFDAHECTTSSPCPPPAQESPPECNTEASCKPAPEPQPEIYGPSGSATFNGPGNLIQPLAVAPPPKKLTTKTVTCKKPKKLSHGKCVKAKSRKKAKKAKKASRDARTKS
jgi:DNA-binding beta-propeller fold protein YncE